MIASQVTPLIICLPKSFSYESNNSIPWKYGATVLEDSKKVMIESTQFVKNITNVSRMTRCGHFFLSWHLYERLVLCQQVRKCMVKTS